MTYSDNPRKIYGKVKIIYSDGEISSEMAVNVSGNAQISYPEQIYMGYLSPSIKACSMDGNSYMGQGFQMNGYGLICGWKSDVHSNSAGTFATPPWLEISFISRPVYKWKVIGDNKLNEYPIDFDITFYSNDVVIEIKQVRNNTAVNAEINLAQPLTEITKIRIDILKWNKPNAKAKILQFFDALEEEYGGSDLKSFEVLEELGSQGVNHGITSDTATITLLNKDRKFDKGYLKDMLLLGRKVIPYIGIENNGKVEYTKLGTFYSDEWNVPQNSQWVTLKCNDKLMKLQDIVYTGYPYTEDVSLYDIAEDILIKSGYATGSYEIDSDLNNDIIPYAFLRKSSAWEAITEICLSGMCSAYIDRDDKLKIYKTQSNESGINILPSSIFNYSKNSRLTDFSNYVEVQYTNVLREEELVKAYENQVILDANGRITVIADYSEEIADAVITISPLTGLELISFESGVNAGKFEIKNNTGNIIVAKVSIEGYKLSISTQTAAVQEDESVERWGRQEVSYQSSCLIQSYEKAYETGQHILLTLKQGSAEIDISWRGDPELKLMDKFTATDRFSDSTDYVCQYNRYSYDGGLKQQTKGRADNGGME